MRRRVCSNVVSETATPLSREQFILKFINIHAGLLCKKSFDELYIYRAKLSTTASCLVLECVWLVCHTMLPEMGNSIVCYSFLDPKEAADVFDREMLFKIEKWYSVFQVLGYRLTTHDCHR